jgi:hypothetical protein
MEKRSCADVVLEVAFFCLFFLLFFVKKAKQHMKNNQNDKKPALESEAGDPKPTGVVRCGARMRLDVRT